MLCASPVGPLGAQAVYEASNIASSIKKRLWIQIALVELCTFTLAVLFLCVLVSSSVKWGQ